MRLSGQDGWSDRAILVEQSAEPARPKARLWLSVCRRRRAGCCRCTKVKIRVAAYDGTFRFSTYLRPLPQQVTGGIYVADHKLVDEPAGIAGRQDFKRDVHELAVERQQQMIIVPKPVRQPIEHSGAQLAAGMIGILLCRDGGAEFRDQPVDRLCFAEIDQPHIVGVVRTDGKGDITSDAPRRVRPLKCRGEIVHAGTNNLDQRAPRR